MPLSSLRPVLAAIVVALVTATSLLSSATPTTAQSTHPIVERALQDLDTWQGQCWQWMKKVVYDATGKTVGFGYRQGYLDAGGFEVSISEAQAGDIIQIVDDAWDGPGADYNGLHTAIILENNGDGTFDAIDSNQKWDGIVRLRPNYDPAAAAARYGIDFHIYRITGEPASGSRAAAPEVSEPVEKGDRATVNTPGECLNLRTAPGGEKIRCLPHGAEVLILSGPVNALGMEWVEVQTSAGKGWMATEYLKASETQAAGPVGDTPVLQYRAFIPFELTYSSTRSSSVK